MTSPLPGSPAGPDPTSGDADIEPLVLEVEKEFSTMVIKARQAIRRRATSVHPELQPLGYKVLTLLTRKHAWQQILLADELQVDKATMSRMIKWLETNGLVTRVPDPQDGRAMLVSITETARTRVVTSTSASRAVLRERLAAWDPDEIKRFADLLARLNADDLPQRKG